MSEQPSGIRPPAEAGEFSVAVIQSDISFVFTPAHRMRAAHCLICGDLIGGEPAVLTGAAALAGDACDCGQVVSDVYLAHARHWPMPGEDLEAAIHRGLHCHNDHP